MKTPLVIVLVIVVAMLGFLTVYSQQHEMVTAVQGQGVADGSGAPGSHAAPLATPVPGGK